MGQSNKMQEVFHSHTHKRSYILGWNKRSAKMGCKRDPRCLYHTPEPQLAGTATSTHCDPSSGNCVLQLHALQSLRCKEVPIILIHFTSLLPDSTQAPTLYQIYQ